MHEVGLMQTALGIAIKHAAAAGATRIVRMSMRLGRLSGASEEALRFAFDVLSKGTEADGAEFNVTPVPLVCRCTCCKQEFEPNDLVFVCPLCGSPGAEILSGRELEVSQLEVV